MQMQLAVGGTLSRPRLTVSAVIVSAITVTTLLLRLLPTTIAAQWVGRGGKDDDDLVAYNTCDTVDITSRANSKMSTADTD